MFRTSRLRAILITMVCGFALAMPGAPLAWEAPVEGGPGGGPFRVFCPAGNFMIGFEGRTGAYIDHLRIICGTWDPASRLVRAGGALPTMVGTSGGGGPARQTCLNGWAVRTISFVNTWSGGGFDKPRQNGFVHHITFTCAWSGSGEEMQRTYGPNTNPVKPTYLLGDMDRLLDLYYSQSCPAGEWAIGLNGRSGLYVDALGLICAPVPKPAITPTIPPQTSVGPVIQGGPSSRNAILKTLPPGQTPPAAAPPAAPPPPLPGMQGQPPVDDQGRVATRAVGFGGNWDTRTDKGWSYAMQLQQNGNNVSGSYVAQNGAHGRITGRVRNNVLEFTWTQDGGFRGTGQFALASDGNSFSGVYRAEPNKAITDPRYLQGSWSGDRR